ncbi:pilus assembly protein TadG-related protein [Fodinicola feengrottensis]
MNARNMAKCLRSGPRSGEDGSITPAMCILALAALVVAAFVLDAGLALRTKYDAGTIAQAAARTGAWQLNLIVFRQTGDARLDPPAAEYAALDYLHRLHATGTVTATTTAVTVTVTSNYRTRLLNSVGLTAIPVAATATAVAESGVTAPNR